MAVVVVVAAVAAAAVEAVVVAEVVAAAAVEEEVVVQFHRLQPVPRKRDTRQSHLAVRVRWQNGSAD